MMWREDVAKLSADDAKRGKFISSVDDAISLLKVDQLVEWSDKWSFRLNSNECNVLHLSMSDNA